MFLSRWIIRKMCRPKTWLFTLSTSLRFEAGLKFPALFLSLWSVFKMKRRNFSNIRTNTRLCSHANSLTFSVAMAIADCCVPALGRLYVWLCMYVCKYGYHECWKSRLSEKIFPNHWFVRHSWHFITVKEVQLGVFLRISLVALVTWKGMGFSFIMHCSFQKVVRSDRVPVTDVWNSIHQTLHPFLLFQTVYLVYQSSLLHEI